MSKSKSGIPIKTGNNSNPGGTPENLIPLTKRDPEEARAIRSRGGKASVKAKRERATFAEAIKLALETDDAQGRVVKAIIKAAQEGNVQAFLALRDTIGEKPIEKAEVTTTIEGSLDDRKKEILERLRECRD